MRIDNDPLIFHSKVSLHKETSYIAIQKRLSLKEARNNKMYKVSMSCKTHKMEIFSNPAHIFDLRYIVFNILLIGETTPISDLKNYHLILAFAPMNSRAIMVVLKDLSEIICIKSEISVSI